MSRFALSRYVESSNLAAPVKSRIAALAEMSRTPEGQLAMERHSGHGVAAARSLRDAAECAGWSAAFAAIHGMTEKGLDGTGAIPADGYGALIGTAVSIAFPGTGWAESGKNLQRAGISVLTYRKVLAACEAMRGLKSTSTHAGESSGSVDDDPVVAAGRAFLGMKKAA